MWIFLRTGFYSVVIDQENPERVQVRARSAEDLVRFKEWYLPELGPIKHTPTRDYPYRSYVSKNLFAIGLSRAVQDMDYTNFKAECHRTLGGRRYSILEKCYAVLMDIAGDVSNRLYHLYR